jgi:hypothetical protein
MLFQQGYFNHSPFQSRNKSISMDFITGLPKVQGKDCIYVVVDRLTKFAHFYAIPAEYNVVQVAKLFFREVFRLHGLPKNIVSDRDSRFIGTFWRELFWLVGTELTPSTGYHPQTDGQTEIVNKWVEGYLRNYVGGQQRTWVKWLHLGEHCYNTTFHMSIGMTPFRALYEYDAPTLVDLVFRESKSSQGQGLDHRESGDSQVVEREPADDAKPTEDKCGQAQDRAQL